MLFVDRLTTIDLVLAFAAKNIELKFIFYSPLNDSQITATIYLLIYIYIHVQEYRVLSGWKIVKYFSVSLTNLAVHPPPIKRISRYHACIKLAAISNTVFPTAFSLQKIHFFFSSLRVFHQPRLKRRIQPNGSSRFELMHRG